MLQSDVFDFRGMSSFRGSSIDIFNNLNRYKGGISSLSFEQVRESCCFVALLGNTLYCSMYFIKEGRL